MKGLDLKEILGFIYKKYKGYINLFSKIEDMS